ncbi:hypothetical protein AJ80_02154 [Polytolypa hystricis UAMH7299]|uniref:DNA polymerase delta subunit 3 n=1 Tax=Polytolypa hystricis (strain UAMH7299) TaxID=1447883 RepID=A0A2B7YPX2_POLH7|nr:hypothetical protein AJ80_02154 [Polytolypa hystricis UAMH7299]
MAIDYKRHLAEQVLNDEEIVTYRSLSRALKVHINLAKRMLYEFHRSENAKKPQSVNATYLITGIQKPQEKRPLKGHLARDGEDEVMQSSPFMSSQLVDEDAEEEETHRVTSVLLVREENLADARDRFETISSIFVYSVQAAPLQDLNVLSDSGYSLLVSQPEDPLEQGRKYGMIQNKNVKRRSGLPPAPPPAAVEPARQPKISKKSEPESKPSTQAAPKQQQPPPPKAKIEAQTTSSKPSSQASTPAHETAKSGAKSSAPKRERGNIFTAFAKTKPKVEKATPEASGAPVVESAEPSVTEDVVMDDNSEEEREDLFLDTGTRSTNKLKESRKEREDKLRKMMEDEDMPDALEPPSEQPNTSAESTPKATETEKLPEPKPEPEPEPESEAPAPTGRRRRSRRQVMKKQVTKDEDGYLVTKEEPVWESFSEDEAPPPAKRKPAVSAGAKAKGAPKTGQGSIMSFFGKK